MMHYTYNLHDYIPSYKLFFNGYKYICIYYSNLTVDRKAFYPWSFEGIDYSFPMVWIM